MYHVFFIDQCLITKFLHFLALKSFSLCLQEKFHDCGKVPWLYKSSTIVEKLHDCEKVSWLWKSSMTVEKFHDCGKVPWLEKFYDCEKVPWLWKRSIIVEKFHDCRKVPWLRKSSMTVEKFLDSEKAFWLWKHFFWLQNKIIDPIILKPRRDIVFDPVIIKLLLLILSLLARFYSLMFKTIDYQHKGLLKIQNQ